MTHEATTFDRMVAAEAELTALKESSRAMKRWIDDLQSGMFINCVYCGHQYGPAPSTPVSMSEVLKAHIRTCPEHPLAAAERVIRAIAENEDCRYASCGLACREYVKANP